MALIDVKPQVGEVAAAHYPAFLDQYHNPMIMLYMGIIEDINASREILIKDAPFHVPEWRVEWFTFGNIPIVNPRFNPLKIDNENKQLIEDNKKRLKKS